MKKTTKLVVLFSLCLICFGAVRTYASTGDTYTGVLTNYLQTEKTAISNLFDTTYDAVYASFAKTGLSIIKSVQYQGLVCLGAIKDEGLLAQLQKDNITFKVAFNKDFVELEKRVLGLEEKKRIQDENDITMFDPGTTYESEKAKLKAEIDAKAQLHRSVISSFSGTYATKIKTLITTYQQYLAANQSLTQGIANKMTRVQGILSEFAAVESGVKLINSKITGLDDIIQKMETSKTKGLETLGSRIQSLIGINVKKYKKLTTLQEELTTQKLFVMGQLQMDLDENLTNNLQTRYNRTKYLALKGEVENFKTNYYTTTNQLNCSSVLATNDTSAALLTKIAAMKSEVNSGLVKIQTEGITTTFKNQLYSGFQSLYVVKFKQRYDEYAAYLKSHIKIALRNLVSSLAPTSTPTPTPDVIPTTTTSTVKTVFNRPFKNNEQGAAIKELQKILANLGLYAGAIDGVYSKATTEAVYKFQVTNGLVNDSNKQVRGYFGPATRTAINALIQ